MLFGAETWLVNPHMGRVLGGLPDQLARCLIGRLPHQRLDGRWEYTLAEAAREEAGFETMETYVWQRHNMAAPYIKTRPMLELCEAEGRQRGDWVGMRWW